MAVLKRVTLESGALTGPNGYDSSNGTSQSVQGDAPILGAYSHRVSVSGANTYGLITTLPSPTYRAAVAFYFRLELTPADGTTVFQAVGAFNAERWGVVVNADRTLQLKRATSVLATKSSPLVIGTVYRIEVHNNLGGANVLALRLAEGDGPSTQVVSTTANTSSVEGYRFGTRLSSDLLVADYDEVTLDDTAIPTLPALPGDGTIKVEPRAGIITGSRIAVSVDRTTAIRSGIVAGSRISITAQAEVPLALRTGVIAGSRIAIRAQAAHPVTLRSGVVAGSRITVMAVAPTDALVAARSGVIAGSRIAVRVDVPVRIRAGVIVGTRPGIGVIADGVVALRSGVIVGSRIHIQQEVRVAIRSGVIIGTRHAFQRHRNVAIRSGVIVGARDGYVGPGTGLIVAGQRFSVNALREGDTFRVVLPWAGLQGMTGLAHVNSRTLRDDRTEQDLNLHISPLDQPNIPALAGGARPVAGADQQDYARRLSRSERTQDRIERDRR